MSLLDPTGDDAAEREAHDEEPRPGVWAGESGADLRALTQDDTDALIRRELVGLTVTTDDYAAVSRSVVGGHGVEVLVGTQNRWALSQRGGIDSDPLVRLLAFRAWGDRDRVWFELRGVRKGDLVTPIDRDTVVRSWVNFQDFGEAIEDARPGQTVRVREIGVDEDMVYSFRVGDRERERPASLAYYEPIDGQARCALCSLTRAEHQLRRGRDCERYVDPRIDRVAKAYGFTSLTCEAISFERGFRITATARGREATRRVANVDIAHVRDTSTIVTHTLWELANDLDLSVPHGRHAELTWDELVNGALPFMHGEDGVTGLLTGDRFSGPAWLPEGISHATDYHVTSVDENRISLSTRATRAEQLGGCCTGTFDPALAESPTLFRGARNPGHGKSPRVPPWARERRRR